LNIDAEAGKHDPKHFCAIPQTPIGNISIVKPTRRTVSQIYFILEQHSTCFGRSLCPSSGV